MSVCAERTYDCQKRAAVGWDYCYIAYEVFANFLNILVLLQEHEHVMPCMF